MDKEIKNYFNSEIKVIKKMERMVSSEDDWWNTWNRAKELSAKALTYPLPTQKDIFRLFTEIRFRRKNSNINWDDCAIKTLFFGICKHMGIEENKMYTYYAFYGHKRMLKLVNDEKN